MSDYEQYGKGTQAKIICDSINTCGNRLTTFVLKYPRMVHAELMTHRMFSRNSSSSRAIPTAKLIQRVVDDPAMPAWWGKNQPGMQARAELEGEEKIKGIETWLMARDQAVVYAKVLLELGVHKQIVNRIIEPWMHITVICTATNFVNWFRLRDHELAQPEIALLAKKMRPLYEQSEPTQLKPGEWHLPFVTPEDREHVHEQGHLTGSSIGDLRAISTARCARVSYLTHDGQHDPDKDVRLHDKLQSADPPHASAFEHCAMALSAPEKVGNLVGWLQYRKLIAKEAIH